MTIVQNLRKAIEIIRAIPDDKLNLGTFRTDTDCGTIACSVGWLAQDPYFIEQGLTLVPTPTGYSLKLGGPYDALVATSGTYYNLDELFGADAFYRLFATRIIGIVDSITLNEVDSDLTDKQLALNRLEQQLKRQLQTEPTC
jgi:hypothetical protein